MKPDRIQRKALETWYDSHHELHDCLIPSTMGLAGEVGEFTDLVKKIYFKPEYARDDNDLIDELGDVLYYVAIIAYQLRISLFELCLRNHKKLASREEGGQGYNKGINERDKNESV